MNPDIKAAVIAMCCGGAIMLAWDLLHGLRRAFFRGAISNFLLDTAWWCFAAAAFVRSSWYANHMTLRAFIWISLAIGAFLYRITLSRPCRALFCAVFAFILKIIQFIFKILLTPALFLYKILVVPFIRLYKQKWKRGGSH